MMGSRLSCLCLPWRNRLHGVCLLLQSADARTDFWLRHLRGVGRTGWSAPTAPLLTWAFLRGVARRKQATNLLATGTYLRDTTREHRNDFERIDSMEVEPYLHSQAAQRFRGFSHIAIHLGDSTSVPPVIVPKLRGKAIHWLDGHYSAGFTGVGASHCPAVVEPESISSLSKDPFESSSTTGGAWARIRLTRRYAMCANLSQRCRTVGHRWQPRRT